MTETILSVTDAARQKLTSVKVGGREATDSSIRIRVLENGTQFRYEFSFVDPESREQDDDEITVDDLRFYVDSQSLPRLRGSTLDFVDDLSGSGFKFNNPNQTQLASHPLGERVQRVLDDHINPGVAQHGGHVSLVGIDGDRVIIQFGGGCQGCGQADVTLKQGVAVAIKEAIPEIAEVVDSTDHDAGADPYHPSA